MKPTCTKEQVEAHGGVWVSEWDRLEEGGHSYRTPTGKASAEEEEQDKKHSVFRKEPTFPQSQGTLF